MGASASRSLQERAEEAFRDLLKKYRRPVTLRDALRESVRMHPANEQTSATIHRLRRRLPGGPSRSYSCAVFPCASHFRRATLWPRACALGLIGSWTLVDALG